jgi:hypothetical protein
MTVLHTGSTRKYAENWGRIFGQTPSTGSADGPSTQRRKASSGPKNPLARKTSVTARKRASSSTSAAKSAGRAKKPAKKMAAKAKPATARQARLKKK